MYIQINVDWFFFCDVFFLLFFIFIFLNNFLVNYFINRIKLSVDNNIITNN